MLAYYFVPPPDSSMCVEITTTEKRFATFRALAYFLDTDFSSG